jgi:hypothetical protein
MGEILTGELGFRRQIPARAHWRSAAMLFQRAEMEME